MSSLASDPRLDVLGWPLDRVGDAVLALSQVAGLSPRAVDVPRVVPPHDADEAWLDSAIGRFADWLGIEAEPVTSAYGAVDSLVGAGGPLLVRVGEGTAAARVLAIVSGRRGSLEVLGPDGLVRRVSSAVVIAAIRAPFEAKHDAETDAILARAKVPARRRERARRALFSERLAGVLVRGAWMLRLAPSAPIRAQLARTDVPRTTALLVLSRVVENLLLVVAWWALGAGALSGNIDPGWLVAWGLLLLSTVPVRAWSVRAEGRIAVDVGALVKSRLLVGALRLEAEETRKEGAGQLLGRVFESQAVENLAIGAGLTSALAAVEIVIAGVVLVLGAAPALEVCLLLASIALATALGVRLHRWSETWSDGRIALTHDTIERLVGHRTRLAQEHPRDRHDLEDQAIHRILERAQRMDRMALAAAWIVPRAWLVLSIAALTPTLIGSGRAGASLAVSIGGALLGFRALKRLTAGISGIVGARIAWGRVRPLFAAASRVEAPPSPRVGLDPGKRSASDEHALVEARDLLFRYAGRPEPVLRGASVRIAATDRILLEGPSGGGKSTFGALIAGLREPSGGLVLLEGLDRRTLGSSTWRSRVAAAPQFHENHVLSAPLAFNLLMGRRWPPRKEDMDEAIAICEELDLGPVLARMPAGILQMVGETGWQLSHGERSRLFVARALLQHAHLIILDESFAALDPGTLRRAIDCVERRAKAVLVVAHP